MAEKVAESGHGKCTFGGNELNTDSLPSNPDPAAYRVGSSISSGRGCGGGGKISFDDLPTGPDGPRHEMVMLHGEQNQDVRGQDSNPAGMLSGHFNAGGEADSDMVKGFEMTAHRLWLNESWIACLRVQLGGVPAGGTPSRMADPENRYWLQLQSDGNYVIYDAVDPNRPKAIFDIWWLMSTLKQLGHSYPR